MRIGHFQCICRDDDFDGNLATLQRGLDMADDAGLDVLSFPESSLTGYYWTGEQALAHSFAVDSPEMAAVQDVTRGSKVMIIAGFNERRGDDLFNSVAVIEEGCIVGTYSKAFPIFDYFTPGREFPVFEKNGFIICADSSHIEPSRILGLKGAQLIFSPHYNTVDDPLDHGLMVRNQHVARAVENQVYMVRGNNVFAAEDYGKLINGTPHFGYGDSFILNPQGQRVAGAGMHDETLMLYELDPERYRRPADRISPSRRSAEALLDELRQALEGR